MLITSGSNDCGVFAIAFAVSLCYGVQPEKFCYNLSQMRGHLINCLLNSKMEPFPVRCQRRIPSTISYHQTIQVFLFLSNAPYSQRENAAMQCLQGMVP